MTTFSFRMPDSLTRWRLTARAQNDAGLVGETKQYITSDKPVYLKWSGPRLFRRGDKPTLGVFIFNQQATHQQVELYANYAGNELHQNVTLRQGANYVALPTTPLENGIWEGEIRQNGKTLDALSVNVQLVDENWSEATNAAIALSEEKIRCIYRRRRAILACALPTRPARFTRVFWIIYWMSLTAAC